MATVHQAGRVNTIKQNQRNSAMVLGLGGNELLASVRAGPLSWLLCCDLIHFTPFRRIRPPAGFLCRPGPYVRTPWAVLDNSGSTYRKCVTKPGSQHTMTPSYII